MKLRILLFMLLWIQNVLWAQTYVSGGISNQTWTPAGSPYIVTSDIIVGRLEIEPGVKVLFNGDYVFEIAGSLIAVGSEQDSIIFTKIDTVDGWQGIFFNQGQPGTKLAYCRIEHSLNSGIRIENTTSQVYPEISHCRISNNFAGDGAGLKIIGEALLSRCTISDNYAYKYLEGSLTSIKCRGGGIYVDGSLKLINCIIERDTSYSHMNGGGSSSISYGGGIHVNGSLVAENCIIRNNFASANGTGNSFGSGSYSRGGGVYCEGEINLKNCIIDNNNGEATGFFWGHTVEGSGLYLNTTDPSSIINSTIAYNQNEGMRSIGDTVNVINSIIFFNEIGQILGNFDALFSDVKDGYPGEGNINFNPIFYSPENLVIIGGSLCTDAGSPDSSFYDIIFPPSLGTERNDIGATGGPGAANWTILPSLRVFDVDPYNVNFGNVDRDQSLQDTLRIINNGGSTLSINSVEISGTHAANFGIITTPSSVVSFSRGELILSFKPDDYRRYHAYVRVVTDQGSAFVPMSGIGGSPQFEASTQAIDFGNVVINRVGEIILTVSNDGIDILEIYDITFDNELFSVDIDNLSIPSGADYDFKVRFSPLSEGLQEGIMSIHNNDVKYDPFLISLSGTGVPKPPPALFSISPQLSFEYRTETQFTVNIRNRVIMEAKLYLRAGGKDSYEEFQLVNTGGNDWATTIPENRVTERGVEYYIEAFHDEASTYYPDVINPRLVPIVGQVNIPHIDFPYTTLADDYQMISLPLTAENNSLQALLVDDLGEYDNKKYRIYDWDEVNDRYIELDSLNLNMNPGRAVWLITNKHRTLDLDTCASTPSGNNYLIQLQEGWNFIGSPFAFDVSWESILSLNRDVEIQGNTLYYYNGASWFSALTMQSFRGYAVKVVSSGQLQVMPVETGVSGSLGKPVVSTEEWYIQIKALNGKYCDDFNFAGVRNTACEEWDMTDIAEPPIIGNYIAVFFDRSNWEKGQGKYAGDFRNPGENGYTYEFDFASNLSGTAELEFISKNLPQGYKWDIISGVMFQEISEKKISISQSRQKFHLIIGTDQYIELVREQLQTHPAQFELMQNYPNPFNPSTKIKFALPNKEYVKVAVYNILGQKIVTLLEKTMAAGYHEVTFNDQNLANGIYFYRLEAGNFQEVRKMVLLK